MKGTLVLLPLFALMLIVPVIAKPKPLTIPIKQAQFQWRTTSGGGEIGAWSWIDQNYETSWDFRLTGKVLHTTISYAPSVTNEEGTSTIYVYNKKSNLWIQHEGTISYTSPYSELTITEYWRGYLNFSGKPSEETFEHGVGYQWGYVYDVDEEIVKAKYPHAVWDETMGAWLLGFSIYLWDTETQSYDISFPEPFIEPVPANNHNPLDL